jgi:hypothetical protein
MLRLTIQEDLRPHWISVVFLGAQLVKVFMAYRRARD